jgi:hypothetical protein
MMKKVLGVLTASVTAVAVVGVAWASSGGETSTTVTSATDDSIASTSGSAPDTSAPTTSQASTSTSQASTSTSLGGTTSTSIDGTTSTSLGGSTPTTTGATTTSSLDDDQSVPDSITTHLISAVGSITVQVSSGSLILVNVNAPGWAVDHDEIESDRIRLRFTSGEAEGEFEARLNNGRVEVKIEVKSD